MTYNATGQQTECKKQIMNISLVIYKMCLVVFVIIISKLLKLKCYIHRK